MPMGGDDDFSVMNIDDFLSENGFDVNDPESPTSEEATSPAAANSDDMDTDMIFEEEPKRKGNKRGAPSETGKGRGPANEFLYVESKRAKMEREKEERNKKQVAEIEFTEEELALATVPGVNFDPRQRRFAPDELRPQPIIRKRKKVKWIFPFYWEKYLKLSFL